MKFFEIYFSKDHDEMHFVENNKIICGPPVKPLKLLQVLQIGLFFILKRKCCWIIVISLYNVLVLKCVSDCLISNLPNSVFSERLISYLTCLCSGPLRFDWDHDAQAWIYRRTKANLLDILEGELEQLCGQPLKLS